MKSDYEDLSDRLRSQAALLYSDDAENLTLAADAIEALEKTVSKLEKKAEELQRALKIMNKKNTALEALLQKARDDLWKKNRVVQSVSNVDVPW